MPRFDQTGPRGQGPMTGRGLGRCVLSQEELDNLRQGGLGVPPGLGLGGGGRGRYGLGRGVLPTPVGSFSFPRLGLGRWPLLR